MRRALQALSLVLALLSAASCRKQAAGPLLPPADEYRGGAQTVPAALGSCALLPPASGSERAAAAAATPRGIYRAAAEGDIAALEATLAGGEPRGLGPAGRARPGGAPPGDAGPALAGEVPGAIRTPRLTAAQAAHIMGESQRGED